MLYPASLLIGGDNQAVITGSIPLQLVGCSPHRSNPSGPFADDEHRSHMAVGDE